MLSTMAWPLAIVANGLTYDDPFVAVVDKASLRADDGPALSTMARARHRRLD
jgi:hypothetical protein